MKKTAIAVSSTHIHVMRVCAVHPFGIDSDTCLDFRPDPSAEVEELWQPEGTEFINGKLKIKREPFSYDCSPVNDRLTPQEKLELLDKLFVI